MANYWAITIGINQYRHLQPLMHAQNDARAIHRFLTQSADITPNHCILLSDLTTSVGDQAVYPDKPAIAQWISTITQQVGADDVLWVFFSGYGVQSDGADYLLPIDGEPDDIKGTGIAIADLIDTLAQLPTDKTLLILDMNRSQGALSGQTISTESIELAQKQQVPLLLSCQPEQFSHETLSIRHGLFTAALLEALQQQSTTLEALGGYVSKRLPELCEHHWRPIQNAVTLIPEVQRSAVVVPDLKLPFTDVAAEPVISEPVVSEPAISEPVAAESATSDPVTLPLAASVANREGSSMEPIAAVGTETDEAIGTAVGTTVVSIGPERSQLEFEGDDRSGDGVYIAPAANGGIKNRADKGVEGAIEPDHGSRAIVPYSGDLEAPTNGAKLRNWGLLALALLLLGGVLFRQPAVRSALQDLTNGAIALTGQGTASQETDSGSEQTEADQAENLENAQEPVVGAVPEEIDAGATGSEAAPETAPAESFATEIPIATASQPPSEPVTASPDSVSASEGGSPEAASAATLIAQANASLQQRQYSEALITLQQVPKAQRDGAFADVLTKARAGAAAAQQANASVLTDARTAIQPTQVSQFSEAIAKARRIQSGEPFYDEAQQDIRSWSQVILDVAEGRATSGNLDGAIAAARVMPYDNAEFYQKAKDRIAFWKQRQNSRATIAAAQKIPRSGQASSYQKGIVKLREVSIEHPEYETAQRLADEWSQRIFSIAQARAAQGRLREAVQAAVLVPAGTSAYEPTQQAIKRWQTQ